MQRRAGTRKRRDIAPDGRTLAVDLQGALWTLPSSGGVATRITDVFDDARQPAWSPDGKWIAFFGYRDGGCDLWAVAPGGSGQHRLTWGPYDDREPASSHDGARIVFSSDRGSPLGSNYNIWLLDVASGDVRQLTTHVAEDSMPSLVARRQGNRLRIDPARQAGRHRPCRGQPARVDCRRTQRPLGDRQRSRVHAGRARRGNRACGTRRLGATMTREP